MASSSSTGRIPGPKPPPLPRKATTTAQPAKPDPQQHQEQQTTEPEHIATQAHVPESKDSPEFHALLGMRVNPPRTPPVGVDALDEPPPYYSDSDADEPAQPPPFGDSGMGLYTAFAGYLQGISAIPDPQKAAARLATYCDSVLGEIKKHVPAAEKPELLLQLAISLNDLNDTLKQTTQWAQATDSVRVAQQAPSPAAVSFRKQTEKALQVYAGHLDPRNPLYNPEIFADKTVMLLNVLLTRVLKHEPEAERHEMLLHFANELSRIAQSGDAISHPDHKLKLVAFLAHEVDAASRMVNQEGRRNVQLKAALDLVLRPHSAEIIARDQDAIMRAEIDARIKSALGDKDNRVINCIASARAIRGSTMPAGRKNEFFAELDRKFLQLHAETPKVGQQQAIIYAQHQEAFHDIQEYVANGEAWPEPAAYQALTDAVNRINAETKARAKARSD